MIEPQGAPSFVPWLIFPQEKAQALPVDVTFGDVLFRCLREELNLEEDEVTPDPDALVWYPNRVPARGRKPAMLKRTFVFAAYIDEMAAQAMTGNPSEVRRIVPVESHDFLSVLPARPAKFQGSLEACTRAVERGLLSQQRWGFMLPKPSSH